jgi:hypothetical protein
MQVNLSSVAALWSEMPAFNETLKHQRKGRNNRISFLLRVLSFLETEGLVQVLDDSEVRLLPKLEHLVVKYYFHSQRKDYLLQLLAQAPGISQGKTKERRQLMPRISRIRVTNIQYDYAKKQFPDLILDLAEQDALVLLTNGGGKTLLLQLIMQVVLPNERLQGRRIVELLQSSKYTGHVAVEWLLDSSGGQKDYVCTGFCFS